MARLVCWLHAWDARAWAQANIEHFLYLLAWGALLGGRGSRAASHARVKPTALEKAHLLPRPVLRALPDLPRYTCRLQVGYNLFYP